MNTTLTGKMSDFKILFVKSNNNIYDSADEFIKDIEGLYEIIGISYKPIRRDEWIQAETSNPSICIQFDLVNRVALIPIEDDWFEYFV